MCRQLEISRAAYYKWLHRPIPKQEEENINLAELIKEYDERFCHILGYRRMTSWINHFNHTNYSKNRSHRIMKKLGIHSVIRKKKKNIIFPNRRRLPKISSKEISMQENLMKMGYRCNGI
ncbi:MAG: IS3 family transposase [Clostridia bacterium]